MTQTVPAPGDLAVFSKRELMSKKTFCRSRAEQRAAQAAALPFTFVSCDSHSVVRLDAHGLVVTDVPLRDGAAWWHALLTDLLSDDASERKVSSQVMTRVSTSHRRHALSRIALALDHQRRPR